MNEKLMRLRSEAKVINPKFPQQQKSSNATITHRIKSSPYKFDPKSQPPITRTLPGTRSRFSSAFSLALTVRTFGLFQKQKKIVGEKIGYCGKWNEWENAVAEGQSNGGKNIKNQTKPNPFSATIFLSPFIFSHFRSLYLLSLSLSLSLYLLSRLCFSLLSLCVCFGFPIKNTHNNVNA